MKKKNLSARFIGKFNSIQSVIFATVAVLVLSAVVDRYRCFHAIYKYLDF